MFTAQYVLKSGHSAVDHFADAIIYQATRLTKPCKSRSAAIRHGEANVRKAKVALLAHRKALGMRPIGFLPFIQVKA